MYKLLQYIFFFKGFFLLLNTYKIYEYIHLKTLIKSIETKLFIH